MDLHTDPVAHHQDRIHRRHLVVVAVASLTHLLNHLNLLVKVTHLRAVVILQVQVVLQSLSFLFLEKQKKHKLKPIVQVSIKPDRSRVTNTYAANQVRHIKREKQGREMFLKTIMVSHLPTPVYKHQDLILSFGCGS